MQARPGRFDRRIRLVGMFAALLVGLVVWARPGLALAGERWLMSVELDTGEETAPAHVCVVHTHGDAQLGLESLRTAEILTGAPQSGTWVYEGPSPKTLGAIDTWAAAFPVKRSTAARALRELAIDSTNEADSCDAYVPGVCEPRFEVRAEELIDLELGRAQFPSHITCAPNPQGGPDGVAVLWVSVPSTDTTVQPRVVRVVAKGAIVTVAIDSNRKKARSKTAVVASLGGHYLPTRAHETVSQRLTLPLERRCRSERLQLPPVASTAQMSARASIFAGSRKVGACTPNIRADHSFLISRPVLRTLAFPSDAADTPQDGETPARKFDYVTVGSEHPLTVDVDIDDWRSVRVSAEGAELKSTSAARIRFTWSDSLRARPDERTERLTVHWHPPCPLLNEGACPRLRVDEDVMTCTGERAEEPGGAEVCAYTCTASEAGITPPKLPLRATFTEPYSKTTWTSVLRAVSQELTDFAPPAERRVLVSTESWRHSDESDDPLTDFVNAPADSIHGLELVGSAGTVQVPLTAAETSILFPGDRCAAPIQYRVRGDRGYRRATADMKWPVLAIPHPSESGKRVKLLAAVGASGYIPMEASTLPTMVVGEAQLGLRWDPFWARWHKGSLAFDFVAIGQFGVKGYEGISDDGPDSHQVAYNRYFLAAGVRALWHWIGIGSSAGVGLGHAFYARDFKRVHARTDKPDGALFQVTPVEFIVRVDWFELALLPARFVVGERYNHFSTDFTGDATRESEAIPAWAPALLLRGAW